MEIEGNWSEEGAKTKYGAGCRLVIARLENRVSRKLPCERWTFALLPELLISRQLVATSVERQAGRQAALSSPSEGERGRMPSPSDHHGNPCTSRHGVVSCVLPCPASMATANLPNSSVDDNLQDFLLLLPLFLVLASHEKIRLFRSNAI